MWRWLLLVGPRDIRAPGPGRGAWLRRGRPDREPFAPRASIGASLRCPARPHRPRAPPPACPAAPPSDLCGAAARPRSLRRPPYRWRWGFCTIRAWLAACRRRVVVLMTPFPPRLAVARSRREVVWCPQRRPPRRNRLTTGCCGRGGHRCGRTGVCRGVLLAGEPINPSTHPIYRMVTG